MTLCLSSRELALNCSPSLEHPARPFPGALGRIPKVRPVQLRIAVPLGTSAWSRGPWIKDIGVLSSTRQPGSGSLLQESDSLSQFGSFSTSLVRVFPKGGRGRCPRGERLIDHVPHGHWKTITFVAGLRRRAMVAPLVLDGPMNATTFVAYLKECLVPKLKRGDVVTMDSLTVHRVAGVREVICEAKLRYLPKYSPDLNPIEQAFSKVKAHLRKAAERTIRRLSRRIGALVAAFSPQECTNYFRHAG